MLRIDIGTMYKSGHVLINETFVKLFIFYLRDKKTGKARQHTSVTITFKVKGTLSSQKRGGSNSLDFPCNRRCF